MVLDLFLFLVFRYPSEKQETGYPLGEKKKYRSAEGKTLHRVSRVNDECASDSWQYKHIYSI